MLRHWFSLVVAGVIALGILLPGAEALFHGYKDYHVMTTMFLTAATIPMGRLLARAFRPAAILLCLFHTFALMPTICWWVGTRLFPGGQGIAEGFLVIGAVSSTISSAVVWTQISRGDDALAFSLVLYSTLSSVLLTPVILGGLLGASAAFDTPRAVKDLAFFVLVPVAAAQSLRLVPAAAAFFDARKKGVSVATRLLVAFIIFYGVAKASAEIGRQAAAPWGLLGGVAGAATLIHLAMLATGYGLPRLLGFAPPQATALMFCSAQKTLILATPIIVNYFPTPSLAILPALFYHVIQLVLDALLFERLGRGNAGAPPPPSRART